MRRTLLIVAIVIILAGIGAAAYFYFFGSQASIRVAPTGNVGLPVAGQGATIPNGVASSTNPSAINSPVTIAPRLVEISSGPVVPGEVAVDVPAMNASSSADVAVTYIERQSGNVFSYSAHTEAITRTSNKTIPGIESAVWLPDASLAFVRYLSGDDFSTINTYALFANGTNGFFLPQDLADSAVSSTSVLTLASGVNGSRRISRTHGRHAGIKSVHHTAFCAPHFLRREKSISRFYEALSDACG